MELYLLSMYDDGHGDVARPLNRLYFDVSSIRSDCTSLSSAFGFRFGRFMVFSMVFAISARRQREKCVVVDVEHKFGDVALVMTFTSTISTLDSVCVSPESLLLFVAVISLVGELSVDDVDVDDAVVVVVVAAFFGLSSVSVL